MSNILITGGFGYIGGRIAKHLANFNHQITLGTRKARPSPIWLSGASVLQINWNHIAPKDILKYKIDIVIHAAGMNSNNCLADPIAALDFNGFATGRLLDAAIAAKVKKFIYFSTAHVYGAPLIGTIDEKSDILNKHPYATSHVVGENAVLNPKIKKIIDAFVIRLSNAYGLPAEINDECWDLLVNDLCKQAIQTGKIVLNTNGTQLRDFIGLNQVCFVLEKLINTNFNARTPRLFNVGSGKVISVIEMARIIQLRCKELVNHKPNIIINQEDTLIIDSKLKYQIDTLLSMGIDPKKISGASEIDNILLNLKNYISI